MSYNSAILTGIYGRRFGLIPLTSGQHGAATAVSRLVKAFDEPSLVNVLHLAS